MIALLLGLAFTTLDLGTSKCTTEVVHCYGLRLHLAGTHDDAVDAAFVREKLAKANQLFAPIGVGFEVVFAERIDDAPVVTTRADRDALGRKRYTRGAIEVFVVDELRDVDDPVDADGTPRQIRGVHWRDRADTDHRWVILSRIAPEHTLGHELGHYFSLPHGTDPRSVMNKAPRAEPPWSERVFVAREQKKMRAAEARMRKSGYLVDRAPSR